MSNAAQYLTEFGFTGLEAEIYAFLLVEWPASGYRIAQAIKKPAANTYKAIETLDQKGAILIEEGDTRLCKAVPLDELIARWARERETLTTKLKTELLSTNSTAKDDRIYTSRSRAFAIGRAQAMLQASKQFAHILADSAALDQLAEDSQAAIERGVDLVFAEVPSGIRMVVDGRLSLLGRGELFYFAENFEFGAEVDAGLCAELAIDRIRKLLAEGAGGKRIAKYLSSFESNLNSEE
jgi:sugar-specific transcriptional regulator TrmB